MTALSLDCINSPKCSLSSLEMLCEASMQPPLVAACLWAFNFAFSSWKACSIGLRPCSWLGHWKFFQPNDGLLHWHRHLFGLRIESSGVKIPNSSTMGTNPRNFLCLIYHGIASEQASHVHLSVRCPIRFELLKIVWILMKPRNRMDWQICID